MLVMRDLSHAYPFRPLGKTAADQTLERSITTQPLTIQPPPLPAMNGVAGSGSFVPQGAEFCIRQASQDSLGIIYAEGEETKIVRPDFVFLGQLADGSIVADIVDPHGIQFGDAMPKLKGLSRYAETFGGQYRRIEAVAKIGDKFRVLDLTEPSTRAAVATATTIKALYESDAAADYLA